MFDLDKLNKASLLPLAILGIVFMTELRDDVKASKENLTEIKTNLAVSAAIQDWHEQRLDKLEQGGFYGQNEESRVSSTIARTIRVE